MKKRVISSTEKKEIVQEYLSSVSGLNVARKHKMAYNTFRKVLSDEGVTMRPSHPRAFSTEQEKEMAQLYRNGYSCSNIGRKYGVNHHTIARALSRQGIAIRSARTFSDEQEQEIARLYLGGETSTDLGKKYGADHHTIIRAMNHRGVKPRQSFMEKLSTGEISRKDVGGLYLDGLSTAQVGVRFGTDRHTIKNILQQQGIEIRSRHDAVMRNALNENAFDVLTPESAYWTGFLMADGNVCYPKRGGCPVLSIDLNVKDKKHVEKFSSFLGTTRKISYSKNNAVAIAVSSQKLAVALSVYGIIPRKSLVATASPILVNNRDFWRGEIDGDGTVMIDKNGVPLVKLYGARPIVTQFSEFIKAHEPKCKATVNPIRKIASVAAYGRYAVSILHILYSDASVSLNRKAATAAEIEKRFGDWARGLK